MRFFRRAERLSVATAPQPAESAPPPPSPQYALAFEPDLLPPRELMAHMINPNLEEWYRWAEEWSVLLRVYADLGRDSTVLDIGCGLGRIAFAIKYVVSEGRYLGFDVGRQFIDFLQAHFTPAHRHFRFKHADIHNSYYNPEGQFSGAEFTFPCGDGEFDLAFAASVFTHMEPETTANYFREAGRALRVGGKCLFSFFILDHYTPGASRPNRFGEPDFNFDHGYRDHGDRFAIVDPENPEFMTSYSIAMIEEMAAQAGLRMKTLVPGLWSGKFPRWIGTQDMVVLEKIADRAIGA